MRAIWMTPLSRPMFLPALWRSFREAILPAVMGWDWRWVICPDGPQELDLSWLEEPLDPRVVILSAETYPRPTWAFAGVCPLQHFGHPLRQRMLAWAEEQGWGEAWAIHWDDDTRPHADLPGLLQEAEQRDAPGMVVDQAYYDSSDPVRLRYNSSHPVADTGMLIYRVRHYREVSWLPPLDRCAEDWYGWDGSVREALRVRHGEPWVPGRVGSFYNALTDPTGETDRPRLQAAGIPRG